MKPGAIAGLFNGHITMAKFTLVPNPTFKDVVKIPTPFDDSPEAGKLTMTFNHLKLSAQKEVHEAMVDGQMEAAKQGGDMVGVQVEYLMKICSGWALKEEFNADNVRELIENYPGAFNAISGRYIELSIQGKREEDRVKN